MPQFVSKLLPAGFVFDGLLVNLWLRRIIQIRVIPSTFTDNRPLLYLLVEQHEWRYGAQQELVQKCFQMHLPADFFDSGIAELCDDLKEGMNAAAPPSEQLAG